MRRVLIAMLNKKGFSQVEIMISLLLLLLVFLALSQTALVGIDSNMTNVLRDEAVSVVEMRMNEARNLPFDDFDLNGLQDPDPLVINQTVLRNFRNMSNFPFNTAMTIDTLNQDTKQVDITVTWNWKERTVANGNPYSHSISTILRRQ